MIRTRMDSKYINEILGNAVQYSYGFLEGAELGQIEFNQKLAVFTADALGKYIDSQARMNPDALHHVYEWGAVGSEGSRLFRLKGTGSKRIVRIEGNFTKSRSVPDNGTVPFVDKASVMENAIEVVIEPKNSPVLVFEDDGETVFTTNAIYIANPGGDEVAGSFGRVVEDFFDNYFKNSLLLPFMATLATADEFTDNFAAGTKGGKGVGVRAGIKYMSSAGVDIA